MDMLLSDVEVLSNEYLLELERLQELHRKNVYDIRKMRAKTFMNDNQVLEEFDKLIKKIENRSTAALPKTGGS